jgi:flagellar biosynthetic protein FliQ
MELARRALLIAGELALPVLAVGLAVGLAVSILQAITQIQDQTLTFVPKIFAMGAAVFILLPWLLRVMTEYAHEVFGQLGSGLLP